MRLKRLELFGFKSFADRTVLSFQHDLIGIVGPNGCGKSNVVDAVRWILGEQRPTSMRGGEMTDVIFKGSASRPAMSVAEGTIVFDNSEGALSERGEEVSVTRRVYKSGEGEYLIDGTRVRLKDVREMLFGTGLGSRGYSVLEQGKIDAILSANALERRAIFEEAAGISRYRQRKKEAESRLKRVQADLVRLDDVAGELEKRERSLKIQAGRARRYVEARDAWRVDGLRLAQHQLTGLGQEIAGAGRALGELEREVEAQRRKRAAAEEDVQAREREIQALSAELARLGAESSDLAGEIRATDERRTQLAARVESWRASAGDESQRAGDLDARHDERRSEAEGLDREIEELEGALRDAKERVLVLGRESAELSEGYQRAARAAEAKSSEALELLQDLTSAKNRVQHLEESLEPLTDREVRAEERLLGVREEVKAAREDERTAQQELERAAEAQSELDQQRARLAEQADELEQRLGELAGERARLEVEAARCSSRIEALRDWDRERESLEGGARELLAALERGEGPQLSTEIAGLLADHVRAESRVARALDAALGRRAQALVVASPEDAVRVLEWLKGTRAGRVALVAPVALERTVSVPAVVCAHPDVRGVLADLAQPEPGYEDLARALLRDAVLVDDAAAGLRLAREYPELRFVTPEGDLFDAMGASGGHVELAHGAVGRRSTADDLEGERRGLEARLEELAVELAREREASADTASELTRLAEAWSRRGAERASASASLDAARARLTELARAQELAQRECEGLAHEKDALSDELEETRAALGDLEANYEGEKSRLIELEEEKQALEAERGQRQRDEGQARVEASGLAERAEALARRRADLERACDELRSEIERATRLSREHTESAEKGVADGVTLARSRDEMLARRGELEERLSSLRENEAKGRGGIDALRRRSEAITSALEEGLGRVSEAKLEKQRLELARADVARRAEADFARPEHELLVDFQPDPELAGPGALEALAARVSELRDSLDKLGPVNLEAVEELEEVSERLSFLVAQKTDLDEARRSLEGTIAKLNEESERRFVEAFTAIREEFRVLFRQLFGGGRADIELEEGVDVLEAGIEIIARPPGRESLPISLLSGGQRTLTALALLFAVFRTNTSPFCILDEVDAALDEANIGRFLSMVEHSLGETQYIIVTHNKGTMGACKVLYGVTMAVRGVSHVVSVQLEDVDEFVPEAVGGSPSTEPLREVELVPEAAPAGNGKEPTQALEPEPSAPALAD